MQFLTYRRSVSHVGNKYVAMERRPFYSEGPSRITTVTHTATRPAVRRGGRCCAPYDHRHPHGERNNACLLRHSRDAPAPRSTNPTAPQLQKNTQQHTEPTKIPRPLAPSVRARATRTRARKARVQRQQARATTRTSASMHARALAIQARCKNDGGTMVPGKGRGDGEGVGPDVADRLDHQPVAPRREDIAPAAFEFGHRVALALAAEDAVAERERVGLAGGGELSGWSRRCGRGSAPQLLEPALHLPKGREAR